MIYFAFKQLGHEQKGGAERNGRPWPRPAANGRGLLRERERGYTGTSERKARAAPLPVPSVPRTRPRQPDHNVWLKQQHPTCSLVFTRGLEARVGAALTAGTSSRHQNVCFAPLMTMRTKRRPHPLL